MRSHCFLILIVFCMTEVIRADETNQGSISSDSKPALFDHIHHLIKRLVSPSNRTTTSAPATVHPNQESAKSDAKLKNSVLAHKIQQTIAPPAVRPCYVRPSFCPATSDACSTSRCARIYSNGVLIGNRYYRRVKCRLNYCRETCGKAEWFADGRRLVGCSELSSTLDSPVWSLQRAYPKSNRLDSRVLPIEREANTRAPPKNGMGYGGVLFSNVKAADSPQQKRSITEWMGSLGDSLQNHTKAVGDALENTYNKIKEHAITKNLTALFSSNSAEEHDTETIAEKPDTVAVKEGASSKASGLWSSLLLSEVVVTTICILTFIN